MTSTDQDDATSAVAALPLGGVSESRKMAVGSIPLRSMVALPAISEGVLLPSEGDSLHRTETEDRETVNARLQRLEERHNATQQMILKLTEMVGELQHQLQDEKPSRSARGYGGGRPIRQRDSAAKKNMPPTIERAPRPRSGSTTQAALVAATALEAVASVVNTPQLPSITPPTEDATFRRSNSITDVAMAAASVALAKVSRVITGRKGSRRSSVIAGGAAYALPPQRPPTLTRRFQVNSMTFNDPKMSKWHRFQHRVHEFFTRDTSIVACGPQHDDSVFLPFTIHHNSQARMMWDSLTMLMITIDIIITPMSLSFRYEPPGIRVFNSVATFLFSIDFAVQALSSYATPKGVVVSGPAHTIPHYVFSSLAMADFFAWFPFEVIMPTTGSKLLGIAKVIRLIKIRQLARRFTSSKKAGLFRMVRLLGSVFLVSHILACYWNWVADAWRESEDGYLEKSVASKYSHCWSLIIGSLNASPPVMHTPVEEISVAMFMLIGNVLQATVFGSVAVLISSFNEEEATYSKKIFDVYERCKLLDIPTDLAERIREYYDDLFRETRSVDPDADSFINELSPALISEVKFQLFREMITQIPFFSAATIDPVVIEMLILKLRTVIYMQDDVLIRKGEFGDWMGFVGSKGSVGMLDPNTDSNLIVRMLQKGDYFGEMGLLHRAKRSNTFVALSWVQIHVLCRRDLDDVKEQYAEEAEGLEDEIERFMTKAVKIAHKDDAGPSKKIMKWLM